MKIDEWKKPQARSLYNFLHDPLKAKRARQEYRIPLRRAVAELLAAAEVFTVEHGRFPSGDDLTSEMLAVANASRHSMNNFARWSFGVGYTQAGFDHHLVDDASLEELEEAALKVSNEYDDLVARAIK